MPTAEKIPEEESEIKNNRPAGSENWWYEMVVLVSFNFLIQPKYLFSQIKSTANI